MAHLTAQEHEVDGQKVATILGYDAAGQVAYVAHLYRDTDRAAWWGPHDPDDFDGA